MKQSKTKRLVYRLILLIGVIACIELAYNTARDFTTGGMPQAPGENQQAPTLEVSHKLEKNDLHLTLQVKGFSFSVENMGKENRYGEGHVHIYVDGKKVAKAFDKTYVVKDLSSGSHEIVVELAHNNHDSYGVKREFRVNVKP
ncbi:hypothetical protein NDK47_16085 [Brevibacillus ruminantium]|uniref:Uncharacterized protein n=1 Tax=Brevibacillus ruminantium TaxID=2950604 RepID=A0ABY4W9G5_9BACL|nr:hypothetical protein [Brevibacillus ruminantium]USG63693.1 hypothetical protein NDK47_16085 [Brevibacillus ruminantium]